MFSKACEYGIKSLIYIASQSKHHKKVGLLAVSDAIDSPSAYTSKILQKLVRQHIITSEKGPTGGFSVDLNTLHQLNLSTVVYAIDGNSLYTDCGLGLHQCNADKPCPVHDQFVKIRNDLKQMLDKTFIDNLTQEIFEGSTFLKR